MNLLVDISRFEQNAADFAAAAGRTIGDVLAQQGRLLAVDLARRTPPFTHISGSGSFASHRAAGFGAVRRDVSALFVPIDNLPAQFTKSERLRTQMEKAVAARDQDKMRDLARVAHIPASSIIDRPTTDLHNRYRDRRGRVRRRAAQFYIMRPRELEAFIRLKQRAVGRAKGGWAAGANALGARGIPQWVQRHAAGGIAINQTAQAVNPYVTLRNTVSYIGPIESQIHMTREALKHRAIAMEAQTRAKLRGLWGRRSSRRAA